MVSTGLSDHERARLTAGNPLQGLGFRPRGVVSPAEVRWREAYLKRMEDEHDDPRFDCSPPSWKLVRERGIPHRLRGRVWFELLGEPSQEDEELEAESAAKKDVAKDVRRTFRDHPLFTDERLEELEYVLTGQAVYAQEMSFLGAFLLLQMGPKHARAALGQLVRRRMPAGYFDDGPYRAALEHARFLQSHLLPRAHERLADALKGVQLEAVCSSWFTTLFTDGTLPPQTAVRVMDLFLLAECPLCVVFRASLALLVLNEKPILQASADRARLLQVLTERGALGAPLFDCDAFVDAMFSKSVVGWFVDREVKKKFQDGK